MARDLNLLLERAIHANTLHNSEGKHHPLHKSYILLWCSFFSSNLIFLDLQIWAVRTFDRLSRASLHRLCGTLSCRCPAGPGWRGLGVFMRHVSSWWTSYSCRLRYYFTKSISPNLKLKTVVYVQQVWVDELHFSQFCIKVICGEKLIFIVKLKKES